jgi:chloramphenicol O-acetyltransferase type A
MRSELDINTWNRKEHFEFFSQFEEPYFGVTVELDCTQAYTKCSSQGIPFFLYYLHKTIKAVNLIEPFRYRILDKKVYICDKINVSATISREDNTFGFSYIVYDEEFEGFMENAQKEIKRVRSGSGLMPDTMDDDVIHFSALPWLNFTSLSHSRTYGDNDSCPKISVGKLTTKEGKKVMPVSVHVHHALMDGYHLSLFVEKFQELMNAD